MPKTVHLIEWPVWEYDDEGFYGGDGSETLAVCKTHNDAVKWLSEHGWGHAENILQDLYADSDYPDRDDYLEYTNDEDGEVNEDEYRADVITRMFTIKKVDVIRYD